MNKYHYNAELIRVVDGDTVDLAVDLGFNVKVKERFRLFGINAPESRTRDLEEKARGLAAKEALKTFLEHHSDRLVVRSIKDKKGKYGRYLGELLITAATGGYTNVNVWMVQHGFAVKKDY